MKTKRLSFELKIAILLLFGLAIILADAGLSRSPSGSSSTSSISSQAFGHKVLGQKKPVGLR